LQFGKGSDRGASARRGETQEVCIRRAFLSALQQIGRRVMAVMHVNAAALRSRSSSSSHARRRWSRTG